MLRPTIGAEAASPLPILPMTNAEPRPSSRGFTAALAALFPALLAWARGRLPRRARTGPSSASPGRCVATRSNRAWCTPVSSPEKDLQCLRARSGSTLPQCSSFPDRSFYRRRGRARPGRWLELPNLWPQLRRHRAMTFARRARAARLHEQRLCRVIRLGVATMRT